MTIHEMLRDAGDAVRFGARCVRYNPADLDALIERRTGRPCKATGGKK